MDWDDIAVATALGASLATVISVLLNAWWRLIDRSEAGWVWNPRGTPRLFGTHDRSTSDTGLRLQPELLQAGDGTAFQISVQAIHCKVGFLDKTWAGLEPVERLPIIPMASPGHHVYVMISCPPEDMGGSITDNHLDTTANLAKKTAETHPQTVMETHGHQPQGGGKDVDHHAAPQYSPRAR